MTQESSLDHESVAVQKHLQIMQDVISRMAENSRSCKVWCVTLVAAVLVLVARTGEPRHALIALVPTALLYLMDAYYLMLERGFRKSYDSFVDRLHVEQLATSDLYAVIGCGSKVRRFLWALFLSLSVLPFYLVVVVTILLTWVLIF